MTSTMSTVEPTAPGHTRRSPARTSAVKPGSRCRTARHDRCSMTTCGISPMWSGSRSRCPYRRRFDFTTIADPRWRLGRVSQFIGPDAGVDDGAGQ